jgi:hypothetical protein
MTLKMETNVHDITMSEAEAWAVIERAGQILNVPGELQFALADHPTYGPEYKAKVKELLHILVDGYDIGESVEDEEGVTKIAKLFSDVTSIQINHMLNEISEIGKAMHFIPLGEMITGIDRDLTKLGALTAEQEQEVRNLGDDHSGVGVAVLEPRIAKVISAGVRAAGGQVEFGALQVEVKTGLPKVVLEDAHSSFANQITGAMSKAMTMHAVDRRMGVAQLCSTVESIIAAKQAIACPTVALWHLSPDEVAECVPSSLMHSIQRRMGIGEEAMEESTADMPAEAKATSTLVQGNGTVN